MGTLQTGRGAMRRRIAAALKRRARQGARDERGAVAIIFALSIVVLVPLVLGLFDLYTASEQKARLQDAVDAAALYAARSELMTDTEINDLASKALNANLKLLRGATLVSSNFRLADDGTTVVGSATIQPMAIAPAFWTSRQVTVGTEVVRNSRNLEVALVLDQTWSMNGSKLSDLKVAAKELVDLVIKEQQAPYYSRMAVVPWAAGVNVGALADTVRPAATPAKSITAASFLEATGKSITGVTKNDPGVVTSASHGFKTGDTVYITGVNGMTRLNGRYFTVTYVDGDKFRINQNTSGNNYKTYTNGGTATKCRVSTCSLVVTSAGHGFNTGDYVVPTDLAGLGDVVSNLGETDTHHVNEYVYKVTKIDADKFVLNEAVAPSGAYSGTGGKAWCTNFGCAYYRFKTQYDNSTYKTYKLSTCVSERTGAEAYTDAAPSVAQMGRLYPATEEVGPTEVEFDSPCPTQSIKPLTSTKKTITDVIDGMKAEGTTAGQVGVAWGWYMLSPNFNSLWSGNPAAEYTKPDTLKVAVVMTDGALNTAYCNGISSSDSLVFPRDRIKFCNATNGATFAQTKELCRKMKEQKIVIYTVGFDIAGDATAKAFVNDCASDPAHVYLPQSGSQLKEAFKQIGAELNNLRLAK